MISQYTPSLVVEPPFGAADQVKWEAMDRYMEAALDHDDYHRAQTIAANMAEFAQRRGRRVRRASLPLRSVA